MIGYIFLLMYVAVTAGVMAAPLPPSVQPIIGILTMPPKARDDHIDFSYISSPYVNYLESGGAVVTPILFNSTENEIKEQFKMLSGVFFTGGPAKPTDFDRYYKTEQLLISLAKEHGMPVWGTCLGFQSIADIAAGGDVLSDFDSENMELPLELTPEAAHSRMFGNMSEDMLSMFTDRNYTTNWHHYGVSVTNFSQSVAADGFVSLSTNLDGQGARFVSTMEHQTLPIYAVQWHPEANAFNYDHDTVDHSVDAVRTMNYLASFFVQEARTKGMGPGNVAGQGGEPGTITPNVRWYPTEIVMNHFSYVFH